MIVPTRKAIEALVAEMKKFHAEITESDGGESEQMRMTREAAAALLALSAENARLREVIHDIVGADCDDATAEREILAWLQKYADLKAERDAAYAALRQIELLRYSSATNHFDRALEIIRALPLPQRPLIQES